MVAARLVLATQQMVHLQLSMDCCRSGGWMIAARLVLVEAGLVAQQAVRTLTTLGSHSLRIALPGDDGRLRDALP